MLKQSKHPHPPAQLTSNSNATNSMHSAAAASLIVKISKITKKKHVLYFRLSRQKHSSKQTKTVSELELCADVIVSAAARRSISVGGGGGPPIQKNRRRRRGAAWEPKTFFSKIHKKISFYPQKIS